MTWVGLLLVLLLLAAGGRPAPAQTEAAPRTARVEGVSTAPPYGGNLLVFKEPSQAAPRLGFISNGDVVQLITVDGFFARVVCPKFPDGGWVWGSYLQIEDQEAPPGGVGEPTLLRLLKEQEDAATRRDPARVRPMAPRADPALVASLGRLLKPATRR
ncbi:MAG: SH3 domain-containing protein [Candidatus Riflebacteria bacterium]|nr:SH3 domain-containing protein [Candidatus Riflebacteria bacterium]